MKTIIGIDVGLTGGIAILSDDGILLEDMPTMMNGKGNARVKRQVDARGLRNLVLPAARTGVAYVEQVSTRPGQGIASSGSLMHSLGVVEGVLGTLGIETHMVTPQAWKKALGVTGKAADGAEIARAMAIRMFPDVAHLLTRKKDHNLADALLIAAYGRAQTR